MSDNAGENPATPIDLGSFPDPATSRLLGMIVTLGAEVHVLRATVERLTQALRDNGVVTDTMLAEAENAEPLAAALAREREIFAAELLRPWLDPDPAADVRRFMAMK